MLDQYKERKPRDPTIAERFNTYRFADHKERVHRPAGARLRGERVHIRHRQRVGRQNLNQLAVMAGRFTGAAGLLYFPPLSRAGGPAAFVPSTHRRKLPKCLNPRPASLKATF